MNWFIYKLYLCGNWFFNLYHGAKSRVFFLKNIIDTADTNRLMLKFYTLYYLKCCSNLVTDSYHELVSIKLTNGHIDRTIIYKNISLHTLVNRVRELYIENSENIFDENEIIMMKRFPVLDIYYKDHNSEKVSVNDIILEYADKNKYYENNSIKNIMNLEKKTIYNNKIYVLYLKMIKRVEKEIDLNDLDYHVTDLYE